MITGTACKLHRIRCDEKKAGDTARQHQDREDQYLKAAIIMSLAKGRTARINRMFGERL